jgi:tetratricopeptide (TPR) repeat protein
MRAPSLVLPVLAMVAGPALALDLIELKDGKVLQVQTATVEGTKLRVRLHTKADQYAAYTIPISKVIPEFVYYAWAKQLKEGDVASHLRLAAWSRKQGLFRHAMRTYETTAKFSEEVREDLDGLKEMMYEEEATWNFAEAERLFREGDVKGARIHAEAILEGFANTEEVGRTTELLSIIKEREQFLGEQKKQEEVVRLTRKQRRLVDQYMDRIRRADRAASYSSFSQFPIALQNLQYAGYTYMRASAVFDNLLPRIEVDDLRQTVKALRDDLDERSIRTFVKLADYYYLAGSTPRALDAVHEVLALDPDNRAAEGLRERILDQGDPGRADGDMAWPVLASRRGIFYPGAGRGGWGGRRFKPAYHAFPYPRRTFHTYPKPWRYHWYAVQMGLP